jgi:uncharacterized protein YjbJ (UPF0337 family)
MNWDQIEGKWEQAKGRIKSKWAKLTDDDIQNLDGKRETLVGALQTRYGMLKEDAERQIDDWLDRFDSNTQQRRDDQRYPRP